jgi:hypothetical protein
MAARRRCGGVAACGARAAAGDAGDRVSPLGVGRHFPGPPARIPPGLKETGHVEGGNVTRTTILFNQREVNDETRANRYRKRGLLGFNRLGGGGECTS